MIMENAYYSVISPEGCAGIIWKDGSRGPEAADAMKITSNDLLKLGVVDKVIKEPVGGAHIDYDVTAVNFKEAIVGELAELSKLSDDELKDQRYERFRKLGETA